jgi:hypothetical protein
VSSAGEVVAVGSPRFALHTLGWRAFQDLCMAVLREVWGQSVQSFADSNDGGRDGAFYGVWQPPSELGDTRDIAPGPFVVQCKNTTKADATLAPSELEDEFAKVRALVRLGMCGTYVLLTNARVTGASEEKICQQLRACGVAHPLVLDGQWVSDMIAAHRELRMFVPRVYGLGDLSQILDERAYAQASVLETLLSRTDCLAPGSEQREGTLLRVPPSLYPAVACRVAALCQQPRGRQEDWLKHHDRQRSVLSYLRRSSSPGFLRAYQAADPHLCVTLMQFDAPTRYDDRPDVLACLHQAGLLSEDIRQQAIARMTELAVTAPDADWAETGGGVGPWDILLTDRDREAMFEHVRRELVPRLEARAEDWAAEFSGDEDDDPVVSALWSYERAFTARQDPDTASKFDLACDNYQQMREAPEDTASNWTPNAPSLRERLSQLRQSSGTQRSLFDDIDQ